MTNIKITDKKTLQYSPSYNATCSAMKKWPYNRGDLSSGDKLVVHVFTVSLHSSPKARVKVEFDQGPSRSPPRQN
jgi:hypothetical protein